MKLSEAILLGSAGSEQGFGYYSIFSNHTKRCALGAALHAIGKDTSINDPLQRPYRIIVDTWPWTENIVKRPKGARKACSESRIVSMIWDLNDSDKWTRPRIAEWVAELEKVYDPTPVEVKECEHATT